MGTIKAVASIKKFVRRSAAELYAFSPGFLRRLDGKVVILTYHRVVSGEEFDAGYIQDGMYVSVESFRSQMRFLKQYFSVISFSELLSMWAEKRWDSTKRYCVVTFDDGWLDNYINALPVLNDYDLPATVFLPTSFVGTLDWFWPDKVGWLYQRFSQCSFDAQQDIVVSLQKRFDWIEVEKLALFRSRSDVLVEWLKTLVHANIESFLFEWAAMLEVTLPADRQIVNWDEVRTMSEAGVSFGSHSVTHAILTKLPLDEVSREVSESWSELKEQRIDPIPVFCYPNGDWSEEVGECVKAAGYQAATTTRFGYEDQLPSNLYGLNRIGVHDDITCNDALFAFHLAGYNDLRSR